VASFGSLADAGAHHIGKPEVGGGEFRKEDGMLWSTHDTPFAEQRPVGIVVHVGEKAHSKVSAVEVLILESQS
jgi:hypothetical protein